MRFQNERMPNLFANAYKISRDVDDHPENEIEVVTPFVDDVDFMRAELTKRGATLLNGPIDRPWGRRTAAFESIRTCLGGRAKIA